MSNEFSHDFISGKNFQKDFKFKVCEVGSKFTWDDLEQPMVSHGPWTERRQLSHHQKRISELEKKNNNSFKQNIEFIDVMNANQAEEK